MLSRCVEFVAMTGGSGDELKEKKAVSLCYTQEDWKTDERSTPAERGIDQARARVVSASRDPSGCVEAEQPAAHADIAFSKNFVDCGLDSRYLTAITTNVNNPFSSGETNHFEPHATFHTYLDKAFSLDFCSSWREDTRGFGKQGDNLDGERYWSHTLGDPIVHLLKSQKYSEFQIERFLGFFSSQLIQALGERFDHRKSNNGSKWCSLMCDDGSPVEMGLAWKAKNDAPHAQVRFAIEPVDDDEVRQSGTNLGATHRLIHQLQECGYLSFNGRDLFQRVDQAVSEVLDSSDVASKTQTRYMVGFDILRPDSALEPLVQIKAYFVLPGLFSPRTAAEHDLAHGQLEKILEAIKDVARAPGFTQLKSYLDTLSDATTGRPVILSVDLEANGSPPCSTRIKVYWRFPNATAQCVGSHMNLGGRWARPIDVGQTAERAWSKLMAPIPVHHTLDETGDYYGAKIVDPFKSTGGSLFYFDLSWKAPDAPEGPARPAPSKAYVPVRHLNASIAGTGCPEGNIVELEITRRCADLLIDTGRVRAARAYLKALAPFCRRSNSDEEEICRFAPVTGTHTYVCAEGPPDNPDICIYIRPLLSPW